MKKGYCWWVALACSFYMPVLGQDPAVWFPFHPKDSLPAASIQMAHWLHKPAGKHGFLQMRGKDYVFEDGTPARFWGVNIADNRPFADSALANYWARYMAGYGINAVRFHKFTWNAIDGQLSTNLKTDRWQRLDYFSHTLAQAGIYYSWSHIYGHRVNPPDSTRLLAYKEVAAIDYPNSKHLSGSSVGLVNFAEDLQDLNIELTVNMLQHINPHSGKRYADDPALSFIELQNEDDIFWAALETALKQAPTYRALLCRKFSRWLQEKYGNDDALRRAWNNEGLKPGESIAAQNIYPHPNHGIFSYHYEQARHTGRPVPRYLADRAAFLYEEQVKFYDRFARAIRATGYKGIIVASCWQAGSGITHYYNLHADYLQGPIDRHNYYGGGKGHTLNTGKFLARPMISEPGSGLLSVGFQQVEDRPFVISEWMSLTPSEFIAESAPLVAAYGMGLQGWDASYAYAMDQPAYSSNLGNGRNKGVYNVTSPLHLGLYPVLSRMVLRGDVQEGPTVSKRVVQIDSLRQGVTTVNDRVVQDYDRKVFMPDMPRASLAAGKVVLSFDRQAASLYSLSTESAENAARQVKAVTGQLLWDYKGKGFVAIHTPNTVGLVGFAQGQSVQAEALTLRSESPFAVILVTNAEPQGTLTTSRRWLIAAVARARNTGMQYNAAADSLIAVGEAPLLLEPVDFLLTLKKSQQATVHVLDHNGRRTNKTLPLRNGKLQLQGAAWKTLYYEVVWPE